jgi:hypothetical protein
MDFYDIIRELVNLEYEVTTANMEGHRASDDDEYAQHRTRIEELRKLLKDISYGS